MRFVETIFLIHSMISSCNAGKFVDDLGQTFDFKGKPTVAVYGGIGARSLYHLGMGLDQIVGVYGIWHIRGSDLDYDNPDAGSMYPDADPTTEEIEFLSKAVNLSPDGDPPCYRNQRGCQTMNYTILKELNPDYFLYIDNGSIGRSNDIITNVTTVAGVENPVVFIDTFYEGGRDCRVGANDPDGNNRYEYRNATILKGCYARSMIDIAERVEELAVAMGVVIGEGVKEEKRRLCETAENFTKTMDEAHERGVRVASAIARSGPGMRVLEPLSYYNLRTYEELGMPIMHADAKLPTYFDAYDADSWFVNCPASQVTQNCNNQVALPVDFWIFDSRSYPYATSTEFKELFPDRALLKEQYWHFARNDGAVSYRQIEKYLAQLASRIAKAERLYDKTECNKGVNVLSEGHYSAEVGGLNGGEYACYDYNNVQTLYLECPSSASVSSQGLPVWSSIVLTFTLLTGLITL